MSSHATDLSVYAKSSSSSVFVSVCVCVCVCVCLKSQVFCVRLCSRIWCGENKWIVVWKGTSLAVCDGAIVIRRETRHQTRTENVVSLSCNFMNTEHRDQYETNNHWRSVKVTVGCVYSIHFPITSAQMFIQKLNLQILLQRLPRNSTGFH